MPSSNKKISSIVYSSDSPPRYYQINKNRLRMTYYGFPLLTLLSLFIVLMMVIYFKEIKESVKRQEPQIIQELKQNNMNLISQNKQLQEMNQTLETKLASTKAQTNVHDFFMLFTQPPGFKDLSHKPQLSIENVQTQTTNNQINLRFDLTNQTENNSRTSGYVFVVMQYKNKLYFFPDSALSGHRPLMQFNDGESFSTSRFRPVNAVFNVVDKYSGPVLFKIIVFSRTGDMINKLLINQQVSF